MVTSGKAGIYRPTAPPARPKVLTSATLVTLSQSDLPSFAEVLADTAGARGALQTFWSLAIANLADYLAGRELTLKCDFTSSELHASVVIDAAPEQVFDSMTQPEHGGSTSARCSPVKSEEYRGRCVRPIRVGGARTSESFPWMFSAARG